MTSEAKARARELVRGLWIAIPTPFTDDGLRLDEDRLAAAVEHYVETLKVDGIFCGGVMGEFWAMSMDERRRCHQLIVEQVAGRVPVMVHVGHHTFSDMVALCSHAIDAGADFGIALNPYYPPTPPPELVREWYTRLDQASPLPMFLFNTRYSGYVLAPEVIAELADLDTVCGVKTTAGPEHILRVQELAGDRIVVTDASERDWLDMHLSHGFQALMSTPALALYQREDDLPVRDYTIKAARGDLDEAWKIHAGLGPARDVADRWIKNSWTEKKTLPIAALKAWLGMLGVPQGPVRPPLIPLSAEETAELRGDLERLGLR